MQTVEETLGAQDPAHQPAELSAASAMYISRKIAETYPLVFESCMILGYNSPWAYPMHDDNKTRIKGTDPVDEESHTHKMPAHQHEEIDDDDLDHEAHLEKQRKPGQQMLLLRLGNLPVSLQKWIIYLFQPTWGFIVGFTIFQAISDDSRYTGTIAAIIAMLLFIPLSLIVMDLLNAAHRTFIDSGPDSELREIPDEEEDEPETPEPETESEEEDEGEYDEPKPESEDKPEPEPEPLVVQDVEEEKEEAKEEMFVEEKTYAREHPEEELNQYSSEDDEAFAERVRMRMMANERKKACVASLKERPSRPSMPTDSSF